MFGYFGTSVFRAPVVSFRMADRALLLTQFVRPRLANRYSVAVESHNPASRPHKRIPDSCGHIFVPRRHRSRRCYTARRESVESQVRTASTTCLRQVGRHSAGSLYSRSSAQPEYRSLSLQLLRLRYLRMTRTAFPDIGPPRVRLPADSLQRDKSPSATWNNSEIRVFRLLHWMFYAHGVFLDSGQPAHLPRVLAKSLWKLIRRVHFDLQFPRLRWI